MGKKLKFCFWGCELKKEVFYPVVLILDIFNVFSLIGLILYCCKGSAGNGYFRFASIISVLLKFAQYFFVFTHPLVPDNYENSYQ